MFKLLWLIGLLDNLLAGHITSWEIDLSYNYQGLLSQVVMPFRLQSNITAGCYLYLEFPTLLGQQYQSSMPLASIKSFGSLIAPAYLNVVNPAGTSNYYIVTSTALSANVWYTLQLDINFYVLSGSYFDPIVFKTTSAFQFLGKNKDQAPQSYIEYDSNYAFNMLFIQEVPQTQAVSLLIANSAPLIVPLSASVNQDFSVTISPTQSINGIVIYLIILNDFTLFPTTFSLGGPMQLTPQDYNYTINGNVLKLVVNKVITASSNNLIITLGIQTPAYQAQSFVRVAGYPRDGGLNSFGQIYGTSLSTNAFQTQLVVLSNNNYLVHWGVPHAVTAPDTLSSTPLRQLFISVDPTNVVYNTVQVSFQLDRAPPVLLSQESFTVRIRIQHDAIIDGSIAHNFGSQVMCADQSQLQDYTQNYWFIVCTGVGNLAASTPYTVTARIAFFSRVIFNQYYLQFGRVEIDYITQSSRVLTNVFAGSAGENLTSYMNHTNMLANTPLVGFQATFGNAQVVSVKESVTTGDAVTQLWSGIAQQESYSIVTRQGNPKQAFIFLLQANKSVICGNQYQAINNTCFDYANLTRLRMKIYYNTQLLQVDTSQGLTFGVYNNTAAVQTYVCPANISYAQCYNLGDAIQNNQTVDSTNKYGLYQFTFGSDMVNTSNLPIMESYIDQFPVFDGTTLASNSSNVVVAMRNVQFVGGAFQPSLYARNDQLLDFMVCFESVQMNCAGALNGTKCGEVNSTVNSCSLINAYALNDISEEMNTQSQYPFSLVNVVVVNYWYNNSGDTVPSFVRISGNLLLETTIKESVNFQSFGLFFDNNLQLDRIVDFGANANSQAQAIRTRTTNNYYCSLDTTIRDKCTFFNGQSGRSAQQSNWQLQTGVIANTKIQSNNFNFIIPVGTFDGTKLPMFVNLVLLNYNQLTSRYDVVKAYRLKGRWGASGVLGALQPYLYTSVEQPELVTSALNSSRVGSTVNYSLPGTPPNFAATSPNFPYQITSYSGSSTTSITFDLATSTTFNLAVSILPRRYGSGVTLVARGSQPFTSSEGQPTACYYFNYRFQYSQLISQALFCPFDSATNGDGTPMMQFDSTRKSLQVKVTGQYSLPNKFNEQGVFAYAISDDYGYGRALNQANNIVQVSNPSIAQCTIVAPIISVGSTYRSQFITYTMQSLTSIILDMNPLKGISTFSIAQVITTSSQSIVLDSVCLLPDYPPTQYTCTINQSSNVATIVFLSVTPQTTPTHLTITIFILPNKLIAGVGITIQPTLQIPQVISVCNYTYGQACTNTKLLTWLWGTLYDTTNQVACTAFSVTSQSQFTQAYLGGLNIQLQSNQTGVRSTFQLVVAPDISMTKVLQNEIYQVDLGWLTEVQSGDFTCQMRQSDGVTLEYGFDRIQRAGFRMLNILAGRDIVLSRNQSWMLVCGGGSVVPTAIMKLTPLISWYDRLFSTSFQQSPANDPTVAQPTFTQAASLVVTLRKTINTPGGPAQYIFNITAPVGVMLTPTTSVIVVEFYKTIAPRLNTQEQVTCYVNDVQADCNLLQDRRLQIKLPQVGAVFLILRILGVTQPSQTNLPSVQAGVWVSLIPDGTYGDTQYFCVVGEQSPIKPIGTFNILNTLIVSGGIRGGANHTITFMPPPSSVIEGNAFMLQFWFTLQPAIYNPRCSLKRQGDNYEWLLYCVWNGYRMLYLYPSGTDGNVTNLPYILTITNGPSVDNYTSQSVYNTLFYNLYFQSNDVITYRSRYYYTQYLQYAPTAQLQDVFFTCYDPQLGTITSGICPVNVGYFSNSLTITPNNATTFQEDLNVILTGASTVNFALQPTSFQIRLGQLPTPILLGAKYNTQSGVYILLPNQTNADPYLQTQDLYLPFFPFLQFKVQNIKCASLKIIPSHTINIIVGQSSFPIKIDFSACIPVEEVVVVSAVSTPTLVSIFDFSRTLRNDGGDRIFNNPYVSFVYQSINLTSAVGKSTQVTFQILGQDGQYYVPPLPLTIKIIRAPTSPIVPIASVPIVSLVANQLQFVAQCNQDGGVYYSTYLQSSPSPPSYQFIVSQTQQGRLQRVPRNTNDQYWRVYGFQFVTRNQPQMVSIPNIKMNSLYSLDYYCVNLNMLVSTVASKRHIQTLDNLSRVIRLTLQFVRNLTTTQQTQLACVLGSYFLIANERVVLESGQTCPPTTNMPLNASMVAMTHSNESKSLSVFNVYFLRDFRATQDLLQASVLLAGNNKLSLLQYFNTIRYPSLQTFNYKVLQSQLLVPQLNITNLNYDNKVIYLSAQIDNMNGFLLVGFGSIQTQLPNLYQLIQGVDANNQTIYTHKLQYANQSTPINYTFYNLVVGQDYFVYICALSEDPSYEAKSSGVIAKPILASKILYIISGQMLMILMSIVCLLLV